MNPEHIKILSEAVYNLGGSLVQFAEPSNPTRIVLGIRIHSNPTHFCMQHENLFPIHFST